jgi:Tfp pilus assembly protein PilN
MMQRLELDFCRTRRGSPWAGRLALALALAVCLDVGLTYRQVDRSLGETQARLAKRAPASRAPKATAQEVAAARETVQRLSLPWDELFMALESAANERVALAAIEPDVRAGTVKISGDGKDYLAALTYVANLSRTEGLEGVQLVQHERKANDPNGPVSFAVSAAWSTK